MSDQDLTFDGNPIHLKGSPIDTGDDVPEFQLVKNFPELVDADDDEWSRGVHIITTAVSVDTPTCATQFREFDERAGDLTDEGIETWYVTRDLPFALDRFAKEHGIENVHFFSDFKEQEFGDKLGLTIDEFDLLSRATFVVDTDGEVVYQEIVSEVADEPDYEAAVEAARKAASE